MFSQKSEPVNPFQNRNRSGLHHSRNPASTMPWLRRPSCPDSGGSIQYSISMQASGGCAACGRRGRASRTRYEEARGPHAPRPGIGLVSPRAVADIAPSLTAHAQSRADEDQGESTKCAVPIAPSPPLSSCAASNLASWSQLGGGRTFACRPLRACGHKAVPGDDVDVVQGGGQGLNVKPEVDEASASRGGRSTL